MVPGSYVSVAGAGAVALVAGSSGHVVGMNSGSFVVVAVVGGAVGGAAHVSPRASLFGLAKSVDFSVQFGWIPLQTNPLDCFQPASLRLHFRNSSRWLHLSLRYVDNSNSSHLANYKHLLTRRIRDLAYH